MRLTFSLCFICILQSFAIVTSSLAQQRLSINQKNISIESIMQMIEDKTDYHFMYSALTVDVKKAVDVEATNKLVPEILDDIFKTTNIIWKIDGRFIALSGSGEASAVAQQKSIAGKVTDSSGHPLPGVTIIIKGTTSGVITDANGNYSITNVPDNATLVFSFVGMKPQEVSVIGKSFVNTILEEESIGLEEVVAIGYGTQRRRDLTGSVASVSEAILKDIPVTSAAQAMVGRMPGVQVTQTEGSPDAEIKIRIRGGGSLTQDNSPLYIVDGFPVDNINDIAPTDIESIDVLKDASSTAIYGARGANGVIIVTSKGGFEGKTKVRYNMYYGISKLTSRYDVLDPYEYVRWQWELRSIQGGESAPTEMGKAYGVFEDIGIYKEMSGTDWQKEIMDRKGTTWNNNLSISGGTKSIKYNISLTRSDVEAVMLGSGYNRTNLVAKTSYQIKDWLSLDMNMRLSDNKLKGAGTSNGARLNHIVQYRPVNGISDFVDPDAESNFELEDQYVFNPLKQTKDDYRRQKSLSFDYDGAFNVQLFKELKYRIEYGYRYTMTTNKRFWGINTSNASQYGYQPLAQIAKTDGKRYRLANILTYSKKDFIADGHSLTGMIGQDTDYSKSESITSGVKYLPKYIDVTSALAMMQLGQPDPIATADNPANVTTSFFGRLHYDYKGKYLASATFRADGSSKFAPGHQWGYFPSAALAWRISDEHFMDSFDRWISDMKFRFSYGAAGNNRISDNAWRRVYSVSSDDLLYMEGNESTVTTVSNPGSLLSNPGLKWETTYTRNLGLDFGLLKDRFRGTVELYNNTTKDLLIKAAIPASSGYTNQWQNIGQTSNKGLEITLNGTISQGKDFLLTASFNIGFNRNHIDKLGEVKRIEYSSAWASSDGAGNDYLVEEGGQVGQMYGYVTDGMYTFDDFDYDPVNMTYTKKPGVADTSTLLNLRYGLKPGGLKLVNQNPDDPDDPDTTVNESDLVDAANDRVIIGNANPKHTGGFGLNAQYKGLDFSVFFNWVYGNNIYNANKIEFSQARSGRLQKNMLSNMNSNDRFTYFDPETGKLTSDQTRLKELNPNSKIWTPAFSNGIFHSWAVEDGSFLRLNNLTLGYSLPSSLLSRLKIEQLRIYVTGYNLWVWTNYSGYDPEVDTQRSTPLTPGVDYNAYPRARTYNVGLNLTF